MYWFTADWHLGHEKIITEEYCNRPFKDRNGEPDIKKMKRHIIDFIKDNLKRGDVLYNLGDVGYYWPDILEVLSYCPPETHIILGNHDERFRSRLKRLVESGMIRSVEYFKEIKVEGQRISLMHYPMRAWPASHYRQSWQLHGHWHRESEPMGLQYNVCFDLNNYKFVSFEQLKQIMEEVRNGIKV